MKNFTLIMIIMISIAVGIFLFIGSVYVRKYITARELMKYINAEYSDYLPLPYHLFTPSSIRTMIGEALPELYPLLDDKMMERVYRQGMLKNKIQVEFAKTPPSSDNKIIEYMDKTGLLAELKTTPAGALKKIQSIDLLRHALKAKSPYAEYYPSSTPDGEVVLPAEFTPIKAVLLQWPIYYNYNWILHAQLTEAITTGNAEAHIVIPNEYWQKGVELYLSMNNISLKRIRFIHAPIDNVWVRDCGPTAVYQKKTGKMCLIANPYLPNGEPYHKRDQEIPVEIGRYYGNPVYRLPFVIEGGNIISDGKGTSIMFDSVLKRNPDMTVETIKSILKSYFGINRLIMLECLTGEITGHVDMVVRFINTDTVMVAKSEPGYKWHKDFETIASKLSKEHSSNDKMYTVIRVPIADNDNDSVNFWSYINSLIVNDVVIVPIFGVPQDSIALDIYRKAMPNYKIISIKMSNYQVGSVHCQTKEIPFMKIE